MCAQSSPFAVLIWNWVEGGVDLYRYLPQLYLIGDKVITDFFSPDVDGKHKKPPTCQHATSSLFT